MLVERIEWDNAVKLFRLKLRYEGFTNLWFYVMVVGAIACMNIVPGARSLLNDGSIYVTTSYPSTFADISPMSAFFAIIFAGAMSIRSDREKSFEVFPHTGSSRFLVVQMLNCLMLMTLGLVTLVYNAVSYAVYSHIAATREDIVILNTFDPGGQLLGLLSWLLFVFTASSLIFLLIALLEKYHLRALIPMTAFAALILAFTILGFIDITYFMEIRVSLDETPSPGSILTPGSILIWVSIWILLTLGAFLSARRTPDENTSAIWSNKTVIAWKVIVLTVIFIIVYWFVIGIFPNTAMSDINIRTQEAKGAAWGRETIIVDATDIPAGSDTGLVMDGIGRYEYGNATNIYDVERLSDEDPLTMHLNGSDDLSHFGGKQIKIKVLYPQNIINGYDTAASLNQRLDAWIDGTALHVKYSYDKPKKTVILPGWNFFGYNTGVGSGNYVEISVVDDAESGS
jgi:hypothetical protein